MHCLTLAVGGWAALPTVTNSGTQGHSDTGLSHGFIRKIVVGDAGLLKPNSPDSSYHPEYPLMVMAKWSCMTLSNFVHFPRSPELLCVGRGSDPISSTCGSYRSLGRYQLPCRVIVIALHLVLCDGLPQIQIYLIPSPTSFADVAPMLSCPLVTLESRY